MNWMTWRKSQSRAGQERLRTDKLRSTKINF